MLKKKILANFSKNYWSFYPKSFHYALKNMGLGSGILEKPIPDPGSRGQKGTGSRIRIRNTNFYNIKFLRAGVCRGLNRKKMFDKNFFSTPLSSTCFWIRDPGSGMGKNQDPGSGINIPDPQHWFWNRGSLFSCLEKWTLQLLGTVSHVHCTWLTVSLVYKL